MPFPVKRYLQDGAVCYADGMPATRAITVRAPAKANLVLRILGRRADGYHLLQMLNVPLTLVDDVTVTLSHTPAVISDDDRHFAQEEITLWCDHPEVPLDATNVCVQAAAAMRAAAGRREPLAITLTKRIPVGGGLGGGSADAAAVLQALNQLWQLGWTAHRLAELGLPLGADIPFFCYGRPAAVGGIGEDVRIYEQFPRLWVLLVHPNLHVATRWAYGQYDLRLTGVPSHGSPLPRFFERFEQVTPLLANDLQAVVGAHHPVIHAAIAALRAAGAAGAQMSGSGSSVLGLFATPGARDAAAKHLEGSDWLVIPTEAVACGA